VKIMDLCYSSIEPGGYLKKAKDNDIVQALQDKQPQCFSNGKRLSRKDRGVKVFAQRNPDKKEIES